MTTTKTECNVENMTALVEALESGKYKQGTLSLRPSQRKYCCLGVACDISDQGEWQHEEYDQYYVYSIHQKDDDAMGYYWAEERFDVVLPPEISEWLGIPEKVTIRTMPLSGDIWFSDTTASRMNDEGRSFKEIAAKIREEYLP